MSMMQKIFSSRGIASTLGFLFILFSPVLLLKAVEQTMSFVHDHVSANYFDNEREMLARNAILPVKFLIDPKKFADELRGSRTRIAVFGESSAAGYASSIGFAEFLEKSLSKEVVVHNFAEPGAPFSGNEAELAQLLMPYYDVIIVFAGHNEIWSHLNNKVRTEGASITLPWGGKVDSKSGDLRQSLKIVSLQKFLANNSFNEKLPFSEKMSAQILGYAYDLSLNSRLVFFIKSFSQRVAHLKDSLASKPLEAVQRLPFFVPEPFLDANDKKEMTANYAKAVSQIVDSLRPDQTLILSTILSNDLFPPLLDAAGAEKIPEAEKRAQSMYESVASGKANFNADDVADLPGAAHSPYLQSVLCVNGISSLDNDGNLSAACLDLARAARDHDTFSNRAHSSINDFIRSMKDKKPNVRVIDPESVVQSARSQKEYFEYFVDFHHPSAQGHMMIANLMISQIPGAPQIVLSQAADGCDTFVATSESERREVKPDPQIFRIQLQNNIAWHDNFMRKAPASWLYQLYKERAESRMRKCIIKS
jgi:hypothetical protein